MEKQPDESEASIVLCWNPEIGSPDLRFVRVISNFIGNHLFLVEPVTGHINVISVNRFKEAGGHVGTDQQVDVEAFQRITESMINPDLN